jgi:TolB protein
MQNEMNKMIIAGIIISILFIPSCDQSVGPMGGNYHNKILFTSNRSGKSQLYMMNPDGTDIQQLTSGEYSYSAGRWSPDVSKIVCNTNENLTTAGMEMVVMNADGTNRSLLGVGSQMAWSPDGKKIAFMLLPSSELGDLTTYIYRVNIDGTDSFQLTNNKSVWDGTPSWSPDGKKIAFASSRDYSSPGTFSEIYLMNADGSNQQRLTHTDSLTNTNPTWSPDGNRIALSCNGLIALMNSDGSDMKVLDSLSTGGLISWSPDGTRLAFGAGKIFTTKIDGSDIKNILTDSSVWGVDWSE